MTPELLVENYLVEVIHGNEETVRRAGWGWGDQKFSFGMLTELIN